MKCFVISMALLLSASLSMAREIDIDGSDEDASGLLEEDKFEIHRLCKEGLYDELVDYISNHELYQERNWARLKVKNSTNESPFFLALNNYHFAIARLLVETGGYDPLDGMVEEQLKKIGKLMAAARETGDAPPKTHAFSHNMGVVEDYGYLALRRIGTVKIKPSPWEERVYVRMVN